jgi:hypothetical protein
MYLIGAAIYVPHGEGHQKYVHGIFVLEPMDGFRFYFTGTLLDTS